MPRRHGAWCRCARWSSGVWAGWHLCCTRPRDWHGVWPLESPPPRVGVMVDTSNQLDAAKQQTPLGVSAAVRTTVPVAFEDTRWYKYIMSLRSAIYFRSLQLPYHWIKVLLGKSQPETLRFLPLNSWRFPANVSLKPMQQLTPQTPAACQSRFGREWPAKLIVTEAPGYKDIYNHIYVYINIIHI